MSSSSRSLARSGASSARPLLENLKADLPAGVVVFLAALPLCLGIALASGAPLLGGLVAGIVGGLVVPLVSRSPLSVSGPAAGLTAIALGGIQQLGFEGFTVAVMLAGVLQLAMGLCRAGILASFVPSSVTKGMLAAIGLLLILKQFPFLLGVSSLPTGLDQLHGGALLVGTLSLAVMIVWEKTRLAARSPVPSALVAVALGVGVNELLRLFLPELAVGPSQRVSLSMGGVEGLLSQLQAPQWSALRNPETWGLALTLGVVASLETLLSLEAVDKLDPLRRTSPRDRELVAQGLGNTVSGLLGGLPVTSVIVRSSVNIQAGGRTRASVMVHAALLLLALTFGGDVLARIPLACLAALLLFTGYKLAKPALFSEIYRLGWSQFAPFVVTIGAILATDLLRGVLAGIAVSLGLMVR